VGAVLSGWIKVEKDLASDPRVLRMASRLRNADVTLGSRSRLVIVGALVTLWWFADTHICEDDTLPIGADQINELVGVENFCELMPADWLQIIDANNVKLVDYSAHNGTTAKKRALGQKRQERHRSNVNADVTPPSRSHNTNCVTRPRPREDLDKTKKKEHEQEARSRALAVAGLDLQAWESWISYRAQRKPAIKAPSLVAAAQELAKFGAEQATVVKHSIANGYQGLFAPKLNGAVRKSDYVPPKTVEQIEDEAIAKGIAAGKSDHDIARDIDIDIERVRRARETTHAQH
jgi:hypothetical protein